MVVYIIGTQIDGLAVLRDRLARVPVGFQGVAEVVVVACIIGLQFDGLAVLRDRLDPLLLCLHGDADVVVAHVFVL